MLHGYARQLGHAQLPHLDTPYSKYSNTNYAASGQDVRAITEILRQREAQLHNVAVELAVVESIMERVRDVRRQFLDKRDQILASMRAHQGLVSCIRRLPPEILSEIFVRCLSPEAYIKPRTRTAPLLLMCVCREWRKVALGTPRLWCSLSARPRHHREEQQVLFFCHHWLSRARGCPLSLAVDMRQNPVEVTQFLQPYTSRVVRLHVTFDSTTVPDLFLKDLPMLEHLSLAGNLRADPNIVIVQPEPRLRILFLDGVVFSAGVLSALKQRWTHLTQLRVKRTHHMDGPVVLSLLALYPHLQDLAFSRVYIQSKDVNKYTCAHSRTPTFAPSTS